MKHTISCLLFSVGLSAVLMLCGCGSGASAPPIFVSLSPSSAQTIDQGGIVNITATVANDSSGRGVTWSLNGPGSLSNQTPTSVTYGAAMSVSSQQVAAVMATSAANSAKIASLNITINPLPTITTSSLANGTTNSVYNQTLSESGGTPPFTWSIISGALPPGLTLNLSTATITGAPLSTSSSTFTVEVTDKFGQSSPQPLSLTVLNMVPLVNQPLVPDAATPGGPGFTLAVNGTGFVSGATVDFNNAALPTTFVSSRQLTAAVPASDILSAGTASITVVNPTPGGGRSNVAFFSIATPETTINLTSPPGSPPSIPPGPGLVSADFNGEGKTDLAAFGVSGGSSLVAILLSNGDGTFTEAPGSPISINSFFSWSGGPCSPLAVGDFNGDGKPDLAVVNCANDGVVTILLGNGDGTFTQAPGSPITLHANVGGPGCTSVAVGDFNGDGKLDFAAVGCGGNSVDILLGNGDGTFSQAPGSPYPVGGEPMSLGVGDFNGDGNLDLAIGDGIDRVNILLGNGDGTFTQASGSPILVGNEASSLAVADFNGDQKLDITSTPPPAASGSNSPVTVLLGNGDGSFSTVTSAATPLAFPGWIAVGDLDGRGKLDLVVTSPVTSSPNVNILLGTGDGTFALGPALSLSSFDPTAVALGDFNGSGRLGLAIATKITSGINILVQH